MTIDRCLEWAYREELPKEGRRVDVGSLASSMGRVKDVADLGTLVDLNCYGVVPDFGYAAEEPHPDALIVAEEVAKLGTLEVEPFDDALICADMLAVPGVVAAARAARQVLVGSEVSGHVVMPLDAAVLVRRYAITGSTPKVDGEMPRLVDVVGAKGRPVWRRRVWRETRWDQETGEPIGWEETEIDVSVACFGGRPPAGSYRVQRLQPDPTPVFVERLTYGVWRAALEWLYARLHGRLRSIALMPTGRAEAPWLGDKDVERGRVLVDLARTARCGSAGRHDKWG